MIGGWTAEHNVLKINFEAVKEGLSSLHWDDILKSDFQHDYNSFFDTLQNLLEKHSPLLSPPPPTTPFANPALHKENHSPLLTLPPPPPLLTLPYIKKTIHLC